MVIVARGASISYVHRVRVAEVEAIPSPCADPAVQTSSPANRGPIPPSRARTTHPRMQLHRLLYLPVPIRHTRIHIPNNEGTSVSGYASHFPGEDVEHILMVPWPGRFSVQRYDEDVLPPDRNKHGLRLYPSAHHPCI